MEVGADYYLTKPFSPNILKTQVITTLDRGKLIRDQTRKNSDKEIVKSNFRLDKLRYQFFKNEKLIKLSSKEIKLMQFFMENSDQVFSKEQIYSNVCDDGKFDANTIMVFINHLRNKIEDDTKNVRYLKTVWGIGYTFIPEGE